MSRETLRRILGSSDLSALDESRVALGLLLAAMVAADGVVKPVERHQLLDDLKTKFGLAPHQALRIAGNAGGERVEPDQLAALVGLALASDRGGEVKALIQELWHLAICDGELHPRERELAEHLVGLIEAVAEEDPPPGA